MYVDEGALIVRHENQGACRWGVLLEHLDQDDPPVVVLADLADKSQEQWEPWTETFSAAVVQWLVYESCMRPGTGDLATGSTDPRTSPRSPRAAGRWPLPRFPRGT